jgi:hypothetical protein
MLSTEERTPRTVDGAPGLVVAGAWAAIFLVLFGATVAGLAVCAVTLAGLVLWLRRPYDGPAPTDPADHGRRPTG